MYDAIVVGARCAGSPTAMLLARRGHKVLLVDRASFPSDTYSTHFIQVPGMVRLARWGLLDRLMATGCPPVTKGRLDMDGQAGEADFEMPAGIPGLVSPRRTILDKLLVDAAVEAGVELREGVMVDRLLEEDGRVVGIAGHTNEGSFEARGRFVIGADGRNSLVARSVGAGYRQHSPAAAGGYYSYWSGVECPNAEMYLYEGQFTVAFPTHDGLTTVAFAVRPEEFAAKRKDADAHVTAMADRLGSLGERLRKGRREHDLVSIGNLASFIREAWGPGWALVGDAVFHKDPSPADGITDAFRGADLLADALHDILANGTDETAALDRYESESDRYALPTLEKTLTMSSFDEDSMTRGTALLEIGGIHGEEVKELLASEDRVPA